MFSKFKAINIVFCVSHFFVAVAFAQTQPPDQDFDGLSDADEAIYGTKIDDPDTDGDGLWDGWEAKQGIPELGIVLRGADPLVKDIYIELDRHNGVAATATEFAELKEKFDLVVAAFNRPKKDHPNGIKLHLEWDEVLTDETEVSAFLPFSRWDRIRKTHFSRKKWLTHRHAFIAMKIADPIILPEFSGKAQFPGEGQSLIVEGGRTRYDIVAITFMHELGHSLGLYHGGFNNSYSGKDFLANFKPNHLSLMNYGWVTYMGLQRDVSGVRKVVFDYQDFDLPAINENSLDEVVGLDLPAALATELEGYLTFSNATKDLFPLYPVGGSIDWNQDGDTVDRNLKENINKGFFKTILNETLNEWARIKLVAGKIGDRSLFDSLMKFGVTVHGDHRVM